MSHYVRSSPQHKCCRESVLGCDEINGTFYWCRSCLCCWGDVMKKNVERCDKKGHYNAPGRFCSRLNGKWVHQGGEAHSNQVMINVSPGVFAHMFRLGMCVVRVQRGVKQKATEGTNLLEGVLFMRTHICNYNIRCQEDIAYMVKTRSKKHCVCGF